MSHKICVTMDQSARMTNVISSKTHYGCIYHSTQIFTKTSPVSHCSGEQWNHCYGKELIYLSNLKFCWIPTQDIAFQWPTWVRVMSIPSPIIAAAPEQTLNLCPLLTCKTVEDIKRTDFDNHMLLINFIKLEYGQNPLLMQCDFCKEWWCNTWLQTPSKLLSNIAQ